MLNNSIDIGTLRGKIMNMMFDNNPDIGYYIRDCSDCQTPLFPFEKPYTSETNAKAMLASLRELNGEEIKKVFGRPIPHCALTIVKNVSQ